MIFRLLSSRRASSIAVCMAFAAIPIFIGCKSERARWTHAQAMNLAANGQTEKAMELLHQAHQQSPKDHAIIISLAEMLAENGRAELSLDLIQDFCDEHPDNKRAIETLKQSLQYDGRFNEALEVYKQQLSDHVSRKSIDKNNLAYYRALANENLRRAGQEINEAIGGGVSSDPNAAVNMPLEIHVAIAAGLISRHLDQRPVALIEIDKRITQYETLLEELDQELTNTITKKIQATIPLGKRSQRSIFLLRARKEQTITSLVNLYATRALLHEDSGHTKAADIDRLAIENLGFVFDDVAGELPVDQECLYWLELGHTYLDTRGFISSLQPWSDDTRLSWRLLAGTSSYESSKDDLDAALLAVQLNRDAVDSPLYNRAGISVDRIKQTRTILRRTEAVLRYHRMSLHQRAGEQAAADRDQLEIERLGYSVDSPLF